MGKAVKRKIKLKSKKNNRANFLLAIIIVSVIVSGSSLLFFAKRTNSLTAIRTVLTSLWSPPSPDPSGIAYDSSTGKLIISDGEVDEMPIYQGANVYISSVNGNLQNVYNTLNFSNEPTGVAFNPGNGHWFFTDDNKRKAFEVDLGGDNRFGTSDDSVRTISLAGYGVTDAEGIAYGSGKLFIADGVGKKIHTINPGPNGAFDGGGDDTFSSFDTTGLGQTDPEGVDYNFDNNTLIFVSHNNKSFATETTLNGQLVKNISLSSVNAKKPAGVAYAPSSSDASRRSLYIVDRGVDNNTDPSENDGKMYELMLDGTPGNNPTNTPTPSGSTPTPTPTSAVAPTATPTPAPTGGSTSVIINSIADSYVLAGSPNSNFGSTNTVQIDGKPVAVGYAKFDLASLGGRNIVSAHLRLRITNGSSAQQNIKAVADNSWSETGINYNNRPQTGSVVGTISGGVASTWLEINITNHVQTKKGQIMSLGFDSTGGDGLDFASKEHSMKPELIVVFN